MSNARARSPIAGPRPVTKANVIRAAWDEFRHTLDVQGALPETMRGTARAPGGFVAYELGFAVTEGVSILHTMAGVSAEQRAREADELRAATMSRRTRKRGRLTGAKAADALRALYDATTLH